MKVSASWQGKVSPVIRVSLTVAPGEIHRGCRTPVEVEEWLRTLLEPRPRRLVVKPDPKGRP